MKCFMSSCKTWKEKCTFCGKGIYYDEYGYSKTKPMRYKGTSIPSKTIYFHKKCYEQEYLDIKKKPVEVVI